jgi:hypothetical protein
MLLLTTKLAIKLTSGAVCARPLQLQKRQRLAIRRNILKRPGAYEDSKAASVVGYSI